MPPHGYVICKTYKCKIFDLVYLGCFNKIPHTEWVKQQTFLTGPKAGKSDMSGYQHGRQPSSWFADGICSPYVLTRWEMREWGVERERE